MNIHDISSADRVVVTGAGGFIGSHLTEELVRAGASVRALVHYNSRNEWGNLELLPRDILESVEIVSGDIRDAALCRSLLRDRDVVFHLAALIAIPYSYSAPASYVDTNIVGTLNILEAARDLGLRRVVHTSTSEVYGTARYVPIDENHPLQGQSPYSATKIGADKIAESFHLSFGLPVVTVRPFNTYGPRQSARAIIPTIISQALSGDVVKLGSLTPVRDLTFATDTARGFMLAATAERAVGQVINLGTGKGISIGDLAEAIFAQLGQRPQVEQDQERLRPQESEVMRLISANARAQDLLGWSPEITLEEGLRATIEWIRTNQDRFKSALYNV